MYIYSFITLLIVDILWNLHYLFMWDEKSFILVVNAKSSISFTSSSSFKTILLSQNIPRFLHPLIDHSVFFMSFLMVFFLFVYFLIFFLFFFIAVIVFPFFLFFITYTLYLFLFILKLCHFSFIPRDIYLQVIHKYF